MIAIVTVLSAFLLGFVFRSRLAANLTYAVAYLWAFTFQSVYLMLSMLNGDKNPAFTADHFPVGYGLVALGIFSAGFGLVEAGHRAGARRRTRAATALLT
jgi:hypothetical protein